MKVTISAEAEEALRQFNLRSAGRGMTRRTPNADGSVTFEMSDDVYERLCACRVGDESFSDVIMRLTGDRPGLQ